MMCKFTSKTIFPITTPTFDPKTDTPLRYFSIKDVFVRCTNGRLRKLYCNNRHIASLENQNILYIYPAFESHHEKYLDAFLRDYTPNTTIKDINPTPKLCKAIHISSKPYTYI